MGAFRKNYPTNVKDTNIPGGAAWTKILDSMGVSREGHLYSGAGFKVDVAFTDTPGAGEIATISNEPVEYQLPMYKELWARVEGGGLGPGELYGVLYNE